MTALLGIPPPALPLWNRSYLFPRHCWEQSLIASFASLPPVLHENTFVFANIRAPFGFFVLLCGCAVKSLCRASLVD